MLNIPDTVKNLFKMDGVRKNFRAHFPNGELPDIINENIVEESVAFTESICSQDVLKFGLTEASVIEFETVGVANMYGMMIECSCEIDLSTLPGDQIEAIQAAEYDGELVLLADSDLGYPFYRVPYGIFRVESCPRNHEVMAHRKVTAYALSYGQRISRFASLPEVNAAPEILVDPALFLAEVSGQLSVTDVSEQSNALGAVEHSLYSSGLSFYDSNRTQYTFTFIYESFGGEVYLLPQRFAVNDAIEFDLISIPSDYDYSKITEIGLHIVSQITALGYDLTYNANGEKIYASNESAFRDIYPGLFGPAVVYVLHSKSTPVEMFAGDRPIAAQPLIPGVLTPYIKSGTAFSFPENTDLSVTNYEIIPLLSFGFQMSGNATITGWAGNVLYVRYKAEGEETWHAKRETLRFGTDVLEIPNFKLHKSLLASGFKVGIENVGTSVKTFSAGTNTYKLYDYAGALNRNSILDGYLELNAQFGKVNRRGELETVRLSNLDAVDILPAEYSQFWWNEFNVEPIGSVLYSYTDFEGASQAALYQFGAGRSTYDMSNNSVLNNLYSATAVDIQALLSELFVPYLAPISFTPIDLKMRGLPYIEDGDYLAVTAEDGTTAYSYNMRNELSGIQILEAEISSVSGEIIDSTEGTA